MNSTEISAEKKRLRKGMLAVRDSLTEKERFIKDRLIRERLFSLDIWKTADIILTYISFGSETDTKEIINTAIAEGKKVYCPRITDAGNRKMEFFLLEDPADTAPGPFGIPEPTGDAAFSAGRADGSIIVLVPGTVFSVDGGRLGYGGGYYDRYLSGCDLKNLYALCYDCLVYENDGADAAFPSDETDVKMTALITESRYLITGH